MFIFFEIKIIYLFAAQKVRHLYCHRRTLSETELLINRKVIVAENHKIQRLDFNAESDMLKLGFTGTKIEQLYREFVEHFSGPARKKLLVVYPKALGLSHYEIMRIA